MSMLLCPFDKNHRIEVGTRFARHVNKCEKQHPDVILHNCLFNYEHYIKPGDEEKHILECNCIDRQVIENFKKLRLGEKKQNSQSYQNDDDCEDVSLAPEKKVSNWLNGVSREADEFSEICEGEEKNIIAPTSLKRYDSIDSLGAISNVQINDYKYPAPASSRSAVSSVALNSDRMEIRKKAFEPLLPVSDDNTSQLSVPQTWAKNLAEHRRAKAANIEAQEKNLKESPRVRPKQEHGMSDNNLSYVSALRKSYNEQKLAKLKDASSGERYDGLKDGSPKWADGKKLSTTTSLKSLLETWKQSKSETKECTEEYFDVKANTQLDQGGGSSVKALNKAVDEWKRQKHSERSNTQQNLLQDSSNDYHCPGCICKK